MSQPTITYRVLHTADEIAPMRDLEARIWHSGLDTTVPGHMMKVVADCGGHVQAAYDGDRMIGFSMGMLSRVHGQWVLWSHMAGVDPDYQAQGIGRQLKLNQRVWALENGFERISWTFNPLLRQNANFNLFVLGGRASTYKINTYGELNDGLNASLPTDRLVADWDLRDDRVGQHAENGPSPLAIEGDVPFVVEQGENDEPIIHQPDWSSPTLAIGIPYDLSRLLREKPEMGREWYEAARASFIPAFERRYVAVDFVRQDGRCWYVLQQSGV
ncbi:MAG: hypothetical protein CL607_10245 [Anaerolineaceae bacterium]|nr:hypothetical protein [Anaerolineaceae bacterium]